MLKFETSCANMGGVCMGNVVPMGATMFSICSFQNRDVLLSYTLSDPLRVAPMGTPPIDLFVTNMGM